MGQNIEKKQSGNGYWKELLRLEGSDQIIQIAFHDAIKLMQRQPDAMIGHTILWEIIGADFFTTLSGPDLRSTLLGN
jgi:hypothetical protein